MKRYTFNPRLGVMVESPAGEWVMHAEAKHRVELARFQSVCRRVKGLEPREVLPVAFLPFDAPGDGVDIDRVHRRVAAVGVA